MQLHHLAYISRSLVEGTDQVIEWELESILNAALRNNPMRGITGALLYSGGYFCQVLEGPESALRELFDTICADPRHTDVNTLYFEPARERQFTLWAMAFAGMEHAQRFQVVGIKPNKDAIVTRQVGRDMIDTLVNLVAERERQGLSIAPPLARPAMA